jgi:hypothetical protein
MTNATKLVLKHPKLYALHVEQEDTRSPILHPMLRDELIARHQATSQARKKKLVPQTSVLDTCP